MKCEAFVLHAVRETRLATCVDQGRLQIAQKLDEGLLAAHIGGQYSFDVLHYGADLL